MSVKHAYKMCYRLERLSRTGRMDSQTAYALQLFYSNYARLAARSSANTRFQPFGGWRNVRRSVDFGYLKWAMFADVSTLPDFPF